MDIINTQGTKTLRDEMAMAALSALKPVFNRLTENLTESTNEDELAKYCYKIASAMMKERDRNDR